MSASWTLEYDGTTQSLAAWGIENPRCTFRSLAADELTFRIPTENVLAAATFPYGATLTLRKDSTVWFIGTVHKEQAVGSRQEEASGYTVLGPWHQLARLAYQQVRAFPTEDFMGATADFTTLAILGQSIVGTRMLTSDVISAVVAYAIAKGVGLTAGTIADGIAFPYAQVRDLSCAEAIIQMARRTPDCVSWFVYSSGTPVLHVARRASLSTTTLDLTAADAIRDLSVSSRPDLVPSGVRFKFINTQQDPETSKLYVQATDHSAGYPDQIGGIVATIELDGSEAVPAGLAAEYFAMLSVTPYEGSLSTVAQDCAGTLRPGKMLRLSNGRAAWATMDALIQEVTEELFSGVTSIQFGAPEHLGPQDWVEQVLFNRRSGAVSGASAAMNVTTIDSGEGYDPDAESDSEAAGIAADATDAATDLAEALKDLADAQQALDEANESGTPEEIEAAEDAVTAAEAAVTSARAALASALTGSRRNTNIHAGRFTNFYFAGIFGEPVDIEICEEGEASTVRVLTPP